MPKRTLPEAKRYQVAKTSIEAVCKQFTVAVMVIPQTQEGSAVMSKVVDALSEAKAYIDRQCERTADAELARLQKRADKAA